MKRGCYFVNFGGTDPYGPQETSGKPNVENLRVTEEKYMQREGDFFNRFPGIPEKQRPRKIKMYGAGGVFQ